MTRGWLLAVSALCVVVALWLTITYNSASSSALGTQQRAREQEVPQRTAHPTRRVARASIVSDRFQGALYSSRGGPLAQATVCLETEHNECCRPESCVQTDVDGLFSLPLQHLARHLILAASGHATRRVSVTEGQEQEWVLQARERRVTLSGVVIDASGGPIAEALVTALAAPTGEVLGTTNADLNGAFGLELDSGAVYLTAHASAYSSTRLRAFVPGAGVVLQLSAASSLTGIVRSESAVPVGEARVTLTNNHGLTPTIYVQTSGPDGSFEFRSLMAGSYSLTTTHPAWRSEPVEVDLPLGSVTGPIDVRVTPAVYLDATLMMGRSTCRVGSVVLNGPAELSATVSTEGRVRIDGIAQGLYQATIECQGAKPRSDSLEVNTVPVVKTWDLDTGLAVSGVVLTAQGAPLAHANVLIQPVSAITREAKAGDQEQAATRPMARCQSDADGNFTCSGLVAGDYECVVWARGQAQSAPFHVSLLSEPVDGVVLRANTTGSIVATLEQTAAQGQIATRSAPHSMLFAKSERGEISVAERRAGEFWFEDLNLGRYKVYPGPNEPPANESTVATLDQPGQLLRVSLAAPSGVELQGVVVDAHGQPVVDAWVSVRGADPTWGIARRGVPSLTRTDGTFVFEGLSPGHYDLQVTYGGREMWLRQIHTSQQNIVVEFETGPPLNVAANEAQPAD